MPIDWGTTLQEQADFVTHIAGDVAETLALPNLTPSQGGDPQVAAGVIRNSQNVAKHYWWADIDFIPLRAT